MNLLLDTQIPIWVAMDHPFLSNAARQAVENTENQCFFSAISAWEIHQKWKRGCLEIPETPDRFLSALMKKHAIIPLSFEMSACAFLEKLPPLHRDPFDRMLICQAMEHGLTFVTSDKTIHQYPIKTLW